MKFLWQTVPYNAAASAQFCDVPGVGRIVARRIMKGRRSFEGLINGRRAITETKTITEAKQEMERVAKRLLALRKIAAAEGVPPPIDIRREP